MRQNLPITQNEYPIPDGSAIISHTDLKGHITFCNEEFVVASGFTRDEVIGQPHNILRHPDMPPEACRDMWSTLERGLPWSGIVKNRRKNGDFYWVKATATPLADRSGYMSVRVKANRAEIAAADALYARMRADAGIRLEQGQLAPTGLAAALGKVLPHPSLKARIHLICGGLAVLTVIVAAAGLNATDHAREALKVAVTDEAAIVRQLSLPPDDPLRASLQR
ncbi:MAG: PAS domain-containing protein, partial [Proteobacteria bacterium]|nr:PAS domain-containing protein [Pseudomonadota bacterium]